MIITKIIIKILTNRHKLQMHREKKNDSSMFAHLKMRTPNVYKQSTNNII